MSKAKHTVSVVRISAGEPGKWALGLKLPGGVTLKIGTSKTNQIKKAVRNFDLKGNIPMAKGDNIKFEVKEAFSMVRGIEQINKEIGPIDIAALKLTKKNQALVDEALAKAS